MWSWRYEGVGKEMGSPEGRRFAASVVLSLLIMLGGIVWTLRIGGDCNLIYHRLAHATEALEGIQQVARAEASPNGRVQ
jgi:hypothetical protein